MSHLNENALNIHLLVLPNVHLLDLAGPAQVFTNVRLNCQLTYISPQSSICSTQGLLLSQLAPLPYSIPEESWLVVIGSSLMEEQLQSAQLSSTVQWLTAMHGHYQRLAAVCSGSLMLAKAGLLDGVRCTTHHELTTQLQQLAPQALVQENTLFIEDGRLFTSAGISTGIDLSLHLVAQQWGAMTAQAVARDMVVYQRRHGNAETLSFWLQHRNHVEQQIHNLQDQLMADPGHDWRLPELARRACLSERQFRRRFEQATGVKVQTYIRLVRFELSKQLLTQTNLGLDRIAERCGFGDERSLRRLWQQLSSMSPSLYRKTHSPAGRP